MRSWALHLPIWQYVQVWGRDSVLVECQTCDWKVVSSNPSRSSGRIFFFRVNLGCWLLFSFCSTPVLPQWHVKDPGHSARSAGGRLHLNKHTLFILWSWSGLTMPLSRHSVGTYQETSPKRNSSGNTQPKSSQLAEPLWTDPGLKLADLHIIKKFFFSTRMMNGQAFSHNPHKREKATTTTSGGKWFHTLLSHPH